MAPRRRRPRPTSVPPVRSPWPGTTGPRSGAPGPWTAPEVIPGPANACSRAAPASLAPSVPAPRRGWLSGVELSLLWMVLVVAWIFARPRNIPHFPTSVAFAVCGLTLASLIVIGRRWPLAGYLFLFFSPA